MALGTACVVAAAPAFAQTAPAPTPPPPPAGGYYMADGKRTTNYNLALESWRTDAQFAVDYTKRFLGLEYAYVLGLSGRGVNIGINDSGVYSNHPLFAGKFTGFHTEAPAGFGNDGTPNPRRPWEIHGTHVAGTAAGGRFADQRMFGNAYGANIVAATLNFSAGDFLWYRDAILDDADGLDPREILGNLADSGKVRIINNSWGVANSISPNITRAQAEAQFRQTLNGRYDGVLRNDVLSVHSAGNSNGAHAGLDASTPLNDMRLRSNWLSVVNYTAAGTAVASSSLCGQTATWCVAGPGNAIISSVNTYTMNTTAIRQKYTTAAYPNLAGIYTGTTVAAIQNAATNAWLNVLNGYLSRRAAAQAAGLPFNAEAEYDNAARQAVAISLAYGSRFVGGDPDGYVSTLAGILVSANNLPLLTEAFSRAVLTRANALLTTELSTFITYNGPGYGALTGTSMAAPNITGMAALLMEWFPEYKTGLITDILVSSSRDLDGAGVDLRSGWGAPQMDVALRGPSALREVREVTVGGGTVDVWSNNITDARDRYSAEVLAGFPNDIGGIIKRGTGELILTGTNTYSGATRAEQGLLTVDGRLTRSALTVTGAGTVGGNGTLASLTATAGGTVSPGSAGMIGTLTVTGAATLGAGSNLLIDAGASGVSDRLVAGTAQLGGGTLTLRPTAGRYYYGDTYTVLTASGGVTGTFGSTTSLSAILYPEARYTLTAVNVFVAARPYASVVQNTPVQTSYARLFDGNRSAYGSLRGLYDLFDIQNAAAIRAAFEQLAPRAETSRRAIGTVATDNMARFYRERLAAIKPDAFQGGTIATIGKPLEFAANAIAMPGQPQTVSDASIATVRESNLPENVAVYLAGGYIEGSGAAMPFTVPQGTRDPFDGFYIAGGVEARVDDRSVLGFGLSYSDIKGETRFGQSAKGELYQGTLYGKLGATYGLALDTQFSAGAFRSTTQRSGSVLGTPYSLSARDSALAISTEVGVSYGMGEPELRLAPRAAVRANRIEFSKTAERGTGPALTFDDDKFLSVEGRVGLQFEGERNGLRPYGSVYYIHDFNDRPGYFQAGLVGGTGVRAPFLVASQDKNWGEMSAGFAYKLGDVELSLGADATVWRKDVRNKAYRAGMRVAF